MGTVTTKISAETFVAVATAAADRRPVSGTTHGFYRYPARFSPNFAAAVIESLSARDDLVLDPYMGGGTTVVEALRSGRRVIGNDLNSLAVFIARVKTTALTDHEAAAIRAWATHQVLELRYTLPRESLGQLLDDPKLKNMTLVRARFIKKIMAGALASVDSLPTVTARDFGRCVILRTGQWALDGRKSHTTLHQFRRKLAEHAEDMLLGIAEFHVRARMDREKLVSRRFLRQGDAAAIHQSTDLRQFVGKVSLVVTSPPYPGVHVLYHRWQVDGRRETPAPYWVANCDDGQGASFYNFGDRHEESLATYFASSLKTLVAIKQLLKESGLMVQMVAFSDPETQLPRYLENMRSAGFAEVSPKRTEGRIWRSVPGRKWHATLKGATASSREVVLIHRANH